LDLTDYSPAVHRVSEYVSVSPSSGSAGTNISISVTNSLPVSYAAKITVTATDTSITPNQSVSRDVVIVPSFYLYNYNNTTS
jgi:hypothetical protein